MMLPEDKQPISAQKMDAIHNLKSKWYWDFADFHKGLEEKYGRDVVERTKLHHILSGSSQPMSSWENYDDDTEGGELDAFVKQVLEKYGEAGKDSDEAARLSL